MIIFIFKYFIFVIPVINRSVTGSPKTICKQEEVICPVHSNVGSCSFKWTKSGSAISVNSKVLKLSDFPEGPGTYQCTADCPVRERVCPMSDVTTVESNSCSGIQYYNLVFVIY